MTTINNTYYIKALDNYPYNLPECIEALNYALSYDENDADALCLMGRLHAEILFDYEKAKTYFEEAMHSDLGNVNTPQYYISCLLNNDDHFEAEKLINFALKIKGIDKANIWYYRSVLSEKRESYKNALKFLKQAKKYCFNSCSLEFMESREKFVKSKLSKNKSKKKKETR